MQVAIATAHGLEMFAYQDGYYMLGTSNVELLYPLRRGSIILVTGGSHKIWAISANQRKLCLVWPWALVFRRVAIRNSDQSLPPLHASLDFDLLVCMGLHWPGSGSYHYPLCNIHVKSAWTTPHTL